MAENNCMCQEAGVLIFPCSGASDVGELSDHVARKMAKCGQARMFCLAGIGAHIQGMVESVKAPLKLLLLMGVRLPVLKRHLSMPDLGQSCLILKAWVLLKAKRKLMMARLNRYYHRLQEEKLKKLFLIILAAAVLFSSGHPICAEQDNATGKVIAYYFHGNFRCYTCHTMEQYSKEAIKNNFKDALNTGKLEFKAVNVEERGNEHFVNDYQLYTKSLVLSLVKDGKEIKSKNLTKIWEYARNKQKFFNYVTEEVNNFLTEAQ